MSKDIRSQLEESNPEFVAEVASLNKEQLDARITQLVKDEDEVEKAKEADEGLQALKDQAREAGAPYRDSKKAIRLKIKLILQLLGF